MLLEQHILNNILKQKTKQKKIKILFPEGNNEKVQSAALKIVEGYFMGQNNQKTAIKDLIEPILLFNSDEIIPSVIKDKIKTLITTEKSALATQLFTIRKNKGLTIEQAEKLVLRKNYYGMLLLESGEVDCLVGGINFTTADILRPALQIIKAKTQIVSSAFIMSKDQENYIFTDASINIQPTAENLVDIATSAIDFVKSLDLKSFDPLIFSQLKVAMLSYSTNGSGQGIDVEKVATATKTLSEKFSSESNKVIIAGEIQFDAAFDEAVRRKKFPSLNFSGPCNIFVFPDLEAANIGYKIAQRLGNFKAIGPVVLGLKKPVNDLSRGATIEDIYETALLTCSQAIIKE